MDVRFPEDAVHDTNPPPARVVGTIVESATRTLAPLRPSTVAILDLPMPTALAIVRGATAAAVTPPWIALVVPRLDLQSTSHPIDDLIRGVPTSRAFDPNWWRDTDPTPETRTVWFVLDGDRDAPITDANLHLKIDARHDFDADHLPPPISLRQAGYDAITIIGRRAVPAPDLSGYVEMCLIVGMRVRCVLA